MESETETVAEVAAHYRAIWQGCEGVSLSEYEGIDVLELVDRFEAAHKREVAALRAKFKTVEDALKPWPSLAEWLVENSTKLGISDMVSKLRERSEEAKNAIAAISGEGVK